MTAGKCYYLVQQVQAQLTNIIPSLLQAVHTLIYMHKNKLSRAATNQSRHLVDVSVAYLQTVAIAN